MSAAPRISEVIPLATAFQMCEIVTSTAKNEFNCISKQLRPYLCRTLHWSL